MNPLLLYGRPSDAEFARSLIGFLLLLVTLFATQKAVIKLAFRQSKFFFKLLQNRIPNRLALTGPTWPSGCVDSRQTPLARRSTPIRECHNCLLFYYLKADCVIEKVNRM